MTEFAIYISGAWTEPPQAAAPAALGSSRFAEGHGPIVRRYDPLERDGNGDPVRADDELWAVVGRPIIDATGRSWWYTTVGIGTSAEYMTVAVRLYDMRTSTWRNFTGKMWQPTYGEAVAGLKVSNWTVRFSNLTPL